MPLCVGQQWELRTRNDNQLVGTLTLTETEMFSLTCDFAPTDAFVQYAPLFERLDLAAKIDESDEFDQLYIQINEALCLIAINHHNHVKEAIFSINGMRAGFRPIWDK